MEVVFNISLESSREHTTDYDPFFFGWPVIMIGYKHQPIYDDIRRSDELKCLHSLSLSVLMQTLASFNVNLVCVSHVLECPTDQLNRRLCLSSA